MNNRNYNIYNNNPFNRTLSSLNQDPNLKEQFNNALIDAMQKVNTNSFGGAGVGYYNPELSQFYQNGYANNEFWDLVSVKVGDSEQRLPYTFKIKPGKKPSEALMAFFNGFTVADCGNVISACQLYALLKVLGKDKFDTIFNDSTRPLYISQFLNGVVDENKNIATTFLNPVDLHNDNIGEIGNRPIEKGQMCQIWGIPYYTIKHPGGFSRLYNVICAGKNESGEDLFVGFGLDGVITERELIRELIDFYNVDRNALDMNAIASSEMPPSYYDMNLRNVKEKLTLEDGLKDVIGFMPNMKVIPSYNKIKEYQNMTTEQIARQFGEQPKRVSTNTNDSSVETRREKPTPTPSTPSTPSTTLLYPSLERRPTVYQDENKYQTEKKRGLCDRILHHHENTNNENKHHVGKKMHDLFGRLFHHHQERNHEAGEVRVRRFSR